MEYLRLTVKHRTPQCFSGNIYYFSRKKADFYELQVKKISNMPDLLYINSALKNFKKSASSIKVFF